MLSIALCTYNGEKYLPEQLDSIARQTYLPTELVVCDDASSDNTVDILKKFKKSAPFSVQIHQNQTNLGTLKNFEKAASLCQGDIIAFSDQDDVWKPEKLERLTGALRDAPKAGYVFSNAALVDEHLSSLGTGLWESIGFTKKAQAQFEVQDQFKILFRKKIVTGATMAIRSKIVRLATPYPIIPYWLHDGWLALVASSIGARGILIDEPLILYRQHQNQQIGALNNKKNERISTLFGKYIDFKKNRQKYFAAWEKSLYQVAEIKRNLCRIGVLNKNSTILKNIEYLNNAELHMNNRRKICTEKTLGSYALILQEALSGRYWKFSDSWRSIFRDIFL